MTLEVQRPSDSPGVVRLVLSNPPANATSIEDLCSIADTIEDVTQDDRVIVISAHGKGFSAGGDVKEMDRLDGPEGILGPCLASARACPAAVSAGTRPFPRE